MNKQLERKLMKVCGDTRWIRKDAVIHEPYIPYLPDNWNRILILAEAQNLSARKEDYVQSLRKMSGKERMTRLRQDAKALRIAPWDDGTLKLAVAAVFGREAVDRVGVSNAVPWSLRNKGANVSPSAALREVAKKLWSEILDVLQPERIVTVGKVAQQVLDNAGATSILPWRSASPNYLSRVSGMLRTEDLLRAFRDVERTARDNHDWVRTAKANKVFFACHAVSMARNYGCTPTDLGD